MRFFSPDSPMMQALSKLADLVVLNFLAVLCSLPVVTLGASAAALYDAVERLMKDEGSTVRNFFRAFGSNFRKATALWLILLALGTVGVVCMLYYGNTEMTGQGVFFVCSVLILVLWSFTVSWVFPLQAKFENTVRGTLTNGLLCALAYLPRSLVMAVLNLLPLGLFLISLPWFVQLCLVWLGIWFSLAAAINLRLLKKPYTRMIGETQETV